MYYHYCYLLGYYPKRWAKFYRVSPLLRDDLLKLKYISQEAKLLQKYQIDTMEQLTSFKENVLTNLEHLKKEEKELAGEGLRKNEKEMKSCRELLSLSRRIEKRSHSIREKLHLVELEKQNEKRREKTR